MKVLASVVATSFAILFLFSLPSCLLLHATPISVESVGAGASSPYSSDTRHVTTRFWKANKMRNMYVPGSETQVHNDYIVGHLHTLLKIIAEILLYYITMSKTSIESLT
jgi:hypothetical protein